MIKINLLSPERKEIGGAPGEAASFADDSKEAGLNIPMAAAVGIATIGLIAYLFITQSSLLDTKTKERDDMKQRKRNLQDVEETLKKLERTKKELEQKVQLIAELKSRQQDAVKMMDKVSKALPEWVWLTSLSFKTKGVNISGKTIHNNLIADFINNLKATRSFANIEFLTSSKRKQTGLDVFDFRLSCFYQDLKKMEQEAARKKKEASKKSKRSKKRNKRG